MAQLGIKDAFANYGTTLKNVQWSVSAWTPRGELVVSLWEHHRRKDSPPKTLVFADSVARWKGPGNSEFRTNIDKAFSTSAAVRLIIVHTEAVSHVESGQDASKVKKAFFVRPELVGKVTEWNGENFAITFVRET